MSASLFLSSTQSSHSVAVSDYPQIRGLSESLCHPLEIEDYSVQTMADVSPPKWHLAHTTWFFETFLLIPHLPGYSCFDSNFGYLFNSYYEGVGERHPRPQRGLLSRPTVAQIYRYRAYVDQAMAELLPVEELHDLIRLGLHHEQQHQELLVTDLKHILATNPVGPVYREAIDPTPGRSVAQTERWLDYPGGVHQIGWDQAGFAFDNETPRHSVYLQDFMLASRLVTNGEYLEFISAGGYQQPEHWLSEGWTTVQTQGWRAPLYWEQIEGQWWIMTLAGLRPLDPDEPVCHVSYFEAEAYARWSGHRLPTEAEWEMAASLVPLQGNFLESERFHPVPATGSSRPDQMFGDVWEWTQSAYLPYPGYQPWAGAMGEYNGKFMCNQMVLRGGSCATPQSHMRLSYRNFFPPAARWQFTGIRLGANP